MIVSRATLGLVAGATLVACGQQPPARDGGPAPTVRLSAARADAQAGESAPLTTHRRIQLAVATGYPEAPMTAAAFDRWMAELRADDPAAVRAVWLLTAVRRAPSDRLGRVWSTARPDEIQVLVRGLAGRTTEGGTVELPPPLRSPATDPDLWLATAVARLHPPFAYSAAQDSRLVAASLDEQLSAARLLAIPAVPWPVAGTTELASPVVWPAIGRSMAARRAGTPPETWVAALTLTGARCRVAPRLWCHAWRAVRDAAPPIQ
ncbi:MAG: hypothetical protein WCJ30_28210, partial [Deltaproteobacteria bacterium]